MHMKKTVFILFTLFLGVLACKKEGDDKGGSGRGGGTTPPSAYTISGTVKGDDGKSLEGVVISDGHICVKTDANGTYWLNSDLAKAEYETFMQITPCPTCKGKRLKPESLAVTVADRNIYDMTNQSVTKLSAFC